MFWHPVIEGEEKVVGQALADCINRFSQDVPRRNLGFAARSFRSGACRTMQGAMQRSAGYNDSPSPPPRRQGRSPLPAVS